MDEKKTKRPRGEERKNRNLHIRATQSQVDFLEILSYQSDKSKTDLLWEALDFWYHNKKGAF